MDQSIYTLLGPASDGSRRDWVRYSQAEGLIHTSPGHRPGFMAPNIILSAESAIHRSTGCAAEPMLSIPNIALVEFHVVFVQQIAVLFLERVGALMFPLVVYVAHLRD